ncbi:MAG TPA: hypothetical protein VIW80_16535 [Pyrinomonadaceae bacterium]
MIQESIDRRWGSANWDILYPWWRQPSKVRILMYADGDLLFSGGTLDGLIHVKTLLESHLYFYADFEITTAHRGRDHSASKQSVKLTDLNLDDFDEIWLFGFNDRGFNDQPDLTAEEKTLLDNFMNEKKGGVLVTGDHSDRGKSIGGEVTRARHMRQYPAPGSLPGESNTTLEEGPDVGDVFSAADQKDDRPQKIRYTLFPLWTPIGFKQRFRPHPLMCSPDGPIDVFPDHPHEGEAVTPKQPDDAEWPRVNGHQELPVVIAWGKIKDPGAIKVGQEIGLVSAYDGHNANVGRIVADSSWHHWVDNNLLGNPGAISPASDAGFDATPAGMVALRKIDAYFLNCATWLAPPNIQAEMRRCVWWSILWTGQIAELSVDDPIWHLGSEALKALGEYTSYGSASEWVLNIPAFREKISNQQLTQITAHFRLLDLPFEQYVAGGIIHNLMHRVGPARSDHQFPSVPPPDEDIESAINDGVEVGMNALTEQLGLEATRLLGMVNNRFSQP